MDKKKIILTICRWKSRIGTSLKLSLKKIYNRLYLYELVYFFFFLVHRYKAKQMNLRNALNNFRILHQISEKEKLDSTRHGRLYILSTKWQKNLFSMWNTLFFGAYMSRVKRVIYFTFIKFTLELNNPFDKSVLMFFLDKKLSLLKRLLARVEKINGRPFDRTDIKTHIDIFHRSSLLQYKIIHNMHEAVRRQKEPEIIRDAKAALKKGLSPLLITVGCSGAYWMRSTKREVAGLFKPFDEEIHAPNNPVGPSLQGALGKRRARWGCRVGEAAHHEVAAFVVDAFLGFGIVPRTYYAEFTHRTFFLSREDRFASFRPTKTKYGSFQEFVGGFVPFVEVYKQEMDKLPLVVYQLLIVLDVILGNTDRNTGNILIGDEKIAAIDHGLCFPDQNRDFSFWYWKLAAGKEPLIPTLVDLLTHFPFNPLSWKLKKNCFISENALDRLRERVVLFTEGIKAGLVPKELVGLLEPEYLYPIKDYKETLQEKAKEQIERYKDRVYK